MKPVLSSNWYRLRQLRPRLRGHVRIHRHEYRDQAWYVFEDRVAGRHHRFNFAAYRVIHLMDGRRDMDTIWAMLSELEGEKPTQDDIIRLLGQLHGSDLLQSDIPPDLAELFERRSKHVNRRWLGRVGNPLALRIPLVDPDAWLGRLSQWLRPLAGARALLAWLALVLPALALLPSHWNELTGNFNERVLAADNLMLLAVLFPLVKLVHEIGHGLVCKRYGGEVHEMGVMMLAFYPVPYVDVSNAAAFVGKWQRALVGAAGMLSELAVAAIAFYAWVLLEPGLARALAYNVAVLASVTTLFFNANPLLRYDGYYILCDVAEIPNLGARAGKHLQYLAERHVFGVRNAQPPTATPGERRWFVAYAPVSYVYRLIVSFGIAAFVATQLFAVGVALAAWTLGQSVLWPIWKGLRALATAPQFTDRRRRIRLVLAGGTAAVALLLFVLPLPYHTSAEGVLWVPERAIMRAEAAGFVRQLVVQPGTMLKPGQAVVESLDPGLQARIGTQAGRVDELAAQYDAAWGSAQARAQQLEQELVRETSTLARLHEEAERLTLRSAVAGELMMDKPLDLPGRYLRKGEVVGYVRTSDPPIVRVVVPQSDVDAVRLATRSVEVKLPQKLETTWPASLVRSVPAAARQLPSAVLGANGGGTVIVDPRDDKGLATMESVFEFELALPRQVPHEFLGTRVHVRFEHVPEPVGLRWLRDIRRAFLSTLQV